MFYCFDLLCLMFGCGLVNSVDLHAVLVVCCVLLLLV